MLRLLQLLIAVTAVCCGFNASANCTLSEDYKQARTTFYDQISESYESCVSSVINAEFWKSFADCLQTRERAWRHRCAHDARLIADSREVGSKKDSTAHCTVFKPSKEELHAEWLEFVEAEQIEKCANSNRE